MKRNFVLSDKAKFSNISKVLQRQITWKSMTCQLLTFFISPKFNVPTLIDEVILKLKMI